MSSGHLQIEDVAVVNPRRPKDLRLSTDTPVSFVPMPAVSEFTATIESAIERPFTEVAKGFTYFANDDVLWAKITPCMENGKAALAHSLTNGVGFGSTEFHVLRALPKVVLPEYLFYFVRQPSIRIAAKNAMRGAAGQQRVPAEFVSGCPFPLCALSEQRKIVEILDQADALRRKRKEADEKAAKILPALFYKMFGDPATNPMGWDETTMEKVIEHTRNGLYKAKEFHGHGTQYLKMFNILNGGLNLDRIDLIDVDDKEYESYCLSPGDILVNRVNTVELVGKCAVITPEVGKAVFESKNIRMRVKQDEVTPEFVATFLNTPFGQASLKRGVKHAIGMATVNNTDLRNTVFIKPPLEKQKQWSMQVQHFAEIRRKASRSNETTQDLFRNLLHRAFSGDLTAGYRERNKAKLEKELTAQLEAIKKNAAAARARTTRRRKSK